MLYIIGLGLNFDGISSYGLRIAKRCKKLYLENYTVDFPYHIKQLEEVLGKNVKLADRKFVESLELVDLAAKQDVALLVYGNPLVATTHYTLIDEAKKSNVKTKVIHAASVLDAITETGLQLYKFGKVASMPKWNSEKNFVPSSFMDIVKGNQKIDAHSLILCDIGLKFKEAITQLKEAAEKHKVRVNKILVCQALGTKRGRILYRDIDEVSMYNIVNPYCIIIPGKLHFTEKEFLEQFKIKKS